MAVHGSLESCRLGGLADDRESVHFLFFVWLRIDSLLSPWHSAGVSGIPPAMETSRVKSIIDDKTLPQHLWNPHHTRGSHFPIFGFSSERNGVGSVSCVLVR